MDQTIFCMFLVVCLAFIDSSSSRSLERRDAEDKSMKKTNTTRRLAALRAEMKALNLSAYIIFSVDAHQSEYTAMHDKRREYISGFTGSAGNAVVTMTEAALWTDGRYYEQAVMEMDSNWVLMKGSTAGTPSRTTWLSQRLKKNDVVGVDPFLISRNVFKSMETTLAKSDIVLKTVLDNLVDKIWTSQPPYPNATVFILSLKFAGKKWQDKVKDMRETMKSKKATAVVLYQLDEIAWLFNIRGSDVPYTPVFMSYSIVTINQITLYVDLKKITPEVRKHLQTDDCSSVCVKLENYSKILDGIEDAAKSESSKLWIVDRGNYAMTMNVNETKLLIEVLSPVSLPKSIKNEVEIEGMKKANLKDALAICQFVEWMEKEVPKGRKDLTELTASAKLEEFKSKQADYVGPSFFSIFGYGPNGAIIHYSPSKWSDRQISTDSTLLVDTGSQYKDGTCDTTRTFHFGSPTHEQKVAYTRVLKANIQLGTALWTNNTKGRILDVFARQQLWRGGLDYRHGTGHGIGMFLGVHEGPQAIGPGCPRSAEKPIVPGMFTSDEPGYYKTGSYGIRIETVMLAVPAKVKSVFPRQYMITFEAANLTPFERKMIIVDMLTKKELDYVNYHHKLARERVGAMMKDQNLMETYDWLVKRTEPLTTTGPSGVSPDSVANTILVVSCFMLYWMRTWE